MSSEKRGRVKEMLRREMENEGIQGEERGGEEERRGGEETGNGRGKEKG